MWLGQRRADPVLSCGVHSVYVALDWRPWRQSQHARRGNSD